MTSQEHAQVEPTSIQVLGIDPAPKKAAAIWSDSGVERRPPHELRDFLEYQLASSPGVLVAWDSPLTFDPARGFSDRPIDKAVRSWVKHRVKEGQIEKGAVSVRPFSGCPHWALSCYVLGLPFGPKPKGLQVASSKFQRPVPGTGLVIETHPAVALAMQWVEMGVAEPLPTYKGSKSLKGSANRIAERLGFPAEAGEDDDTLDAFVAWRLARDFVNGRAVFVGEPQQGGYLLQEGPSAAEILGQL